VDANLSFATGILSVLIGMVVGLSLGLVGAGGSILTVPALIYGLGVPVREAIPSALVLVGTIAANGALHHHRNGTVRLDVAIRFGLAGVVGALVGARLSELASPRLLLILFPFVMLAAAINMARHDSGRPQDDSRPAPTPQHPGWGRMIAAGFLVGLMTGFFGVGGGFVIVPALALFVGLPTRQAVATSLVVIVINCAAGLAGHLTLGFGITSALAWIVVLFAAGGMTGSFLGARLAGRWPEATLSRTFAAILAAVAIYLLIRNLSGDHAG